VLAAEQVVGPAVEAAGPCAASAAGELGAGLAGHGFATPAVHGWEDTAGTEERWTGEGQTVQVWAQR
jgi:hypothetical protein